MLTTTESRPLTPAEALQTPTLFRAWLRRNATHEFIVPHAPSYCPLAAFLEQTTHAQAPTVGGMAVSYYGPTTEGAGGSPRHTMLPAWARHFIVVWDFWSMVPGRRTARQAHACTLLVTLLRPFLGK